MTEPAGAMQMSTMDAAMHSGRVARVKPSGAVAALRLPNAIHGDDLALDRLQCDLGLAVARLRGPVSGRCTVQCGGVAFALDFDSRLRKAQLLRREAMVRPDGVLMETLILITSLWPATLSRPLTYATVTLV